LRRCGFVGSFDLTDTEVISYATFSRRLAAWSIDSAILLSLLLLIAVLARCLRAIGIWTPSGLSPEEAWKSLGYSAKILTVFAFTLSLGPVYFALCEASSLQATLGKNILNIYVTGIDGQRISIGRAVGRSMAKVLLSCYGIGAFSVITIAALRKKQSLHDLAARTLVLRGRPATVGALETWRIAIGLGLPFVWMTATFLATL
jgi:uncharacterized RDD family membrane protein YckC